MVALYTGLVIQTEKIEFPEQITQKEPFVIVSSPSFLEKMAKYEIDFSQIPKRILTAGAKLKDEVRDFFSKTTEIIEIYGSTETGVIAYKKNSLNFKKFNAVKFSTDENNCIIVKSDFFMEEEIKMEDVIDKISEEEFSLKGRNDRLVKIKEKRVSLVELETAIKEYPSVIDCCCLKYGEILASVVVTKDISLTDKVLKEHLSKYSEIIPKKWRFLDEIPKTDTGKVDKSRIEEIFGLNLSYPFVLERRQQDNCVELDVIFKKTSNFFKGHFPNIPVLPGVVQLFYANWFAREVFKIDISKKEAKKVKFTNIIRADDKVTIRLENNEKNVDFTYISGGIVYSSGTFVK
jgi:acyl-coenzyme A synthetase/AMP-(fatty) acid ligase/3-hydroxymyristoyl/3-hydroxydecanoyl-(acyl carrier protein) dehydratase